MIGVTGDAVDMDVYGLPPEAVLANADGIVTAVAAVDGIRATDVTRIAANDAADEVDIADIPTGEARGCARQRGRNRDE